MLDGEKIRLRALEPEDIDLLYKWENDESIWRVSNTIAPFSKYILALYIQNSDKDIYEAKQLRLVIESKDTHNAVGTIDLFEYDPFHKRLGIGILIGETEERNKGFAKEAIELMIRYCFDFIEAHQIWANISSKNKKSMYLFESLGFKELGVKKEWLHEGKEWVDEHMYQLINSSKP